MRAVSLRWLGCSLLLTACGLDTSGTGEDVLSVGGSAGASSVGGAAGAGAGQGGKGGTAGPGGAAGKGGGGGGTAGSGGGASGAAGKPSSCGDGTKNGAEECDDGDLGLSSCATRFPGTGANGQLTCTPGCTIDDSACLRCGDGTINNGEECDGTEVAGKTCEGLLGPGSQGEVKCSDKCTFDTIDCSAASTCQNGVQDPNEECEGTNLYGKTCGSLHPGGQGDLSCTTNCTLNDSQCRWCGNGKKDDGEQCDGTETGGASCDKYGPGTGGTITCSPECTLVEQCGRCGNGVVNKNDPGLPDEECDGASLDGKTCPAGQTGSPSCNDCKISLDTCQDQPTCSDGKTNGGESDQDCGQACGAENKRCDTGKNCNQEGDCKSGVCTGNKCQDPSCADGKTNGQETDRDCGGPDCPRRCIVDTDACMINSDCATGKCEASKCADIGTCNKKSDCPNSCFGERCLLDDSAVHRHTPGSDCPAGWTKITNRCYRRFDNKASWYGAYKACRAEGGNLALLTDQQELNDVGKNANGGNINVGATENNTVWVGLACQRTGNGSNQCNNKGNWKWLDGSGSQDLWGGESPDDARACGVIRLRNNPNNDIGFGADTCTKTSATGLPYLCEIIPK